MHREVEASRAGATAHPGGGGAARPKRPLSTALALGAFVAVAAALQLLAPAPLDPDTAYHVAVGRLLRDHGLLHAFPWTPFSFLARHYADKELLFHLMLAALARLPWITAARIAGTACGAAALAAFYAVLRAERVRWAALWALLPLAGSGAFAFRLALVRPHLLSLALAPIILWAAARRRLAILALSAAVYPWAHVSWHLPVALAALAELARAASGARPRWSPLAVTAGATAAGVPLHPDAANLVRVWWIVLREVLVQNAWGAGEAIPIGLELLPFQPGEMLRYAGPPAAMTVAALALAWRGRRAESPPLAFALAAAGFGILTALSGRFVEYFAPFSALALALALRDVRRPRMMATAVALACTLFTATFGMGMVRAIAMRSDDLPPPVLANRQLDAFACALREAIPPGTQVFTCEWSTTGPLLLALPDRKFLVALDPTLFAVEDPELYRLWADLPREAPPDAAGQIRARFGASHVACLADPSHARFFRALAAAPGVQWRELGRLAQGGGWMVFDLGG